MFVLYSKFWLSYCWWFLVFIAGGILGEVVIFSLNVIWGKVVFKLSLHCAFFFTFSELKKKNQIVLSDLAVPSDNRALCFLFWFNDNVSCWLCYSNVHAFPTYIAVHIHSTPLQSWSIRKTWSWPVTHTHRKLLYC